MPPATTPPTQSSLLACSRRRPRARRSRVPRAPRLGWQRGKGSPVGAHPISQTGFGVTYWILGPSPRMTIWGRWGVGEPYPLPLRGLPAPHPPPRVRRLVRCRRRQRPHDVIALACPRRRPRVARIQGPLPGTGQWRPMEPFPQRHPRAWRGEGREDPGLPLVLGPAWRYRAAGRAGRRSSQPASWIGVCGTLDPRANPRMTLGEVGAQSPTA